MRMKIAFVIAVLLITSSASMATVGWANYQWPCYGAGYADNQGITIYSQAWKGGCTDSPGACADLSATISYKRASEGTWTTAPMTYLGDAGNNDEYSYTIPAAATTAGDPELYTIVWHDMSDNTDYNPADHCGGGAFPPMALEITPATARDVTVTFRVDINCLALLYRYGGIYVAGDFQGWAACTSGMTDGDNDGVYETSVLFPAGSNPSVQFKYNRSGYDGCQWESFAGNRSFIIDDTQPTNILPVVYWDNWTCCQPSFPFQIERGGSYCVTLCNCQNVLSLPFAPNFDISQIAHITFIAGCSSTYSGCNEECQAGDGSVEWGIRTVSGVNFIDMCLNPGSNPPPLTGCFCMTIDMILPVELAQFEATPGDGEVRLNWRTASETDNARFDIVRDGVTVGALNSLGNSTAGHSYSWTDAYVENGRTYEYTLVTVDINNHRVEAATQSATPGSATSVVKEYALMQNYPNPFNPTTSITFDVAETGNVEITVFDVMGKEVARLVNGQMGQGRHTISFDAQNLPAGMYLYRMTAGSFSATHKMLLIK